MPSSSSLWSATTRCHASIAASRSRALLVVDERDAHEVRALLVRRRRPCWRGSRAPRRDRPSAAGSRGCRSARRGRTGRSDRCRSRRSHSESARSVSPSDSASLAASLRIALRATSFASRCAWRSSTPSRSRGWLVCAYSAASRRATTSCSCSAAPLIAGGLDEQLDRALGVAAAARAACARPRRAARPGASASRRRRARRRRRRRRSDRGGRRARRAGAASPRSTTTRASSRAAPRSDPSRRADRRARRAACRPPRAARRCSRGSSAITRLEDADHLARALRRVVVRAQQIERGVAHAAWSPSATR